MDPYRKIRDGVSYPAVLLLHGINDPRVPLYFSAKFAACLQAASASGKPVLLKIDYASGHNNFSPFADLDMFFPENLSQEASR